MSSGTPAPAEDPLVALLRALLPVREARYRLELAEPAEPPPGLDAEGRLQAPLRLGIFEENGALRDMKEQHGVTLAEAAHAGDGERVAAYLRAWARAVPAVVAQAYGGEPDVLMPMDLVFPELLADASLRSEAEFFEALTGDPGRLQRLFEAREEAELTWLFEENLGAGDPRVAALKRLAERPAIELVIEEVEQEDCPVGASRLGGDPDLPPEVAWPRSGDQPLAFIGQINLEEVHAAAGDAASALPPRGSLYFFFGLQGCVWEAPETRGGGKVIFHDGPTEDLARRPSPGREANVETLAARAVTFEVRRKLLPHFESPFYALLLEPDDQGGPEAVGARYTRICQTFGFVAPMLQPELGSDEERPRDRLLGYADPLQGDVYAQCAAEAEGMAKEEWGTWAALARAAGWSLLFQADSDPEAGVYLGDGGLLYFMIRPEDLAARRFDRVWTVWQSH